MPLVARGSDVPMCRYTEQIVSGDVEPRTPTSTAQMSRGPELGLSSGEKVFASELLTMNEKSSSLEGTRIAAWPDRNRS